MILQWLRKKTRKKKEKELETKKNIEGNHHTINRLLCSAHENILLKKIISNTLTHTNYLKPKRTMSHSMCNNKQ